MRIGPVIDVFRAFRSIARFLEGATALFQSDLTLEKHVTCEKSSASNSYGCT